MKDLLFRCSALLLWEGIQVVVRVAPERTKEAYHQWVCSSSRSALGSTAPVILLPSKLRTRGSHLQSQRCPHSDWSYVYVSL